MKKRIFFQLVLPLLCLFLLVALLAFAPTWSRRQPALLEMSVILRESGGFANARQGMEQAAADLNVELRFLVPSADNSAAEQAQLLSHEVEANASAILLIPADREALAESVRAAASRAVLVTLETGMAEQGARACVGTDNAALGQALGQAVLNGVPSGGTVLLLHSAPGDNAVQERLEAASAVLTGAGRKVAVQDAGGLDFQDALSRRPADAILALEASALEAASEAARYLEEFPLLYGAGSTAAIAAGLEQSRVTAIAAQNDFAAGYLAVETAAGLARRRTVPPVKPLPFFILRQETMYAPENQKLLFPVT